MINQIINIFEEHIEVAKTTKEHLNGVILEACEIINSAIVRGSKIILCGNGGSAADAQHIAAEFTGRFVKERKALAAISLTTDTSALTAIGNDYGFDKIFERQVEAIALPGDILIGISTSGNSQNVVNAIKKANDIGCITIGLSGNEGGELSRICVSNIVIPSSKTARIQEMHILVGHIFCDYVDQNF
ncbi:D-sedoheptulose-7-phosphate isomerase [Aquirufa lenticrescens]|uniref:D-sedoheptulose-7-phosphate isomerase n=1 Tax=Aquirufa lenticrescens TaxID=2696560 RepID=UPI001CAA6B4E|nr:D-sedoheptulose 7-phosphate isomerase [Aquirufa lenticrescens]UAJ14207.1 D-sedoheptulose 7-phosphate isomerase [Aquirufa lenticrescens]